DVVKVVSLAREKGGRTSAAEATGALLADKSLDATCIAAIGALVMPGLLRSMTLNWLHLGLGAAAFMLLAAAAWALGRMVRPNAASHVRAVWYATRTSLGSQLSPLRLSRGLFLGAIVAGAEVSALIALSAGLGISLSVTHAVTALVILCIGI